MNDEQMSEPKKWWLISDEDVQVIKKSLMYYPQATRKEALHALESGLHVTDAVPDDWKTP